MKQKELIEKALERSMDYTAFYELTMDYAANGKTSGDQVESFVNYTKLGAARMKRWEKRFTLTAEDVANLKDKAVGQKWLVITESWCGDSGQNMPIINKVAQAAGASLHIVFRDQCLPLMDQFLTRGARAIPKVIALDESLTPLMQWGPRPNELDALYLEEKAKSTFYKPDWGVLAQNWYNKNKGRAVVEDMLAFLNKEHALFA